MTWLTPVAGVVTEWAVEHIYDDGEKRYFTDDYDEVDAREAAEVANLERLNQAELGSLPATSRAVSRRVTYTDWK